MTFAKLDNGITKSSIWSEPYHVRVVWISFLAEKDETGFVAGSRSGMIRVCNVSPEEFDEAIRILSSPDPDSRTPDFEGRRIDIVEGGWIVLNHEKYTLPENIRKENHRNYMREWREKNKLVNSREFTNIHKRSPSISISRSRSSSISVSSNSSNITSSDKDKVALLLEYWNSKECLIHHKKLSKTIINYLTARLKEFTDIDLRKCIDNYSLILSDSSKYWYSYKHGIDEFFRSGDRKPAPYVKFLPERFVEENFLTKKGGGYNGKPVSRNCKPDDQYSSVY
jgi:hypothetical protein